MTEIIIGILWTIGLVGLIHYVVDIKISDNNDEIRKIFEEELNDAIKRSQSNVKIRS